MKTVLLKVSDILPYRDGLIAGIGRSSIGLIEEFLRISDPDIKFKIYCTGFKSLFFRHFYSWHIIYHSLPIYVRRSTSFSKLIEPYLRKYFFSYDLFHITSNYDKIYHGEPFVVTIHDLILYHEDRKCQADFHTVALKSKAIITCSEYTKTEIVKLLGVSSKKIHVIPWGINHRVFSPQNEDEICRVKSKFGISNDYFFSCSCGSQRKNPDISLEAFAKLTNKYENIKLVMVWGNFPTYLKEKYRTLIKKKRIIIISGVSDHELSCLYTGAIATLFISSAEGFGFPLLESFACGTPCITCNNTSLSELGRNLAYFVKERNVEETSDAIEYYFLNRASKSNKDAYIQYASNFTWYRTATEYIRVYKEILYDK